MAQSSLPWTAGGGGDDGPYSANVWRNAWQFLAGKAGADLRAGVLRGSRLNTPYAPLRVEASSPVAASVRVRDGRALLRGYFYENSADVTLTIAANSSGNGRIDTVMMQVDTIAQTIRLAIKQGTPAVSPVRPTLSTTGAVLEYPLADVTVANGFTVINAADIFNYPSPANGDDAVIIPGVMNQTGTTLIEGDVVIWGLSSGDVVVATTSAPPTNSGRVAGVWVGGPTAVGERGFLLVKGMGYVNVNGAVTARRMAISLAASKQGSVSPLSPFAYSMQTTSGAGLCLCYVDAGQEMFNPICTASAQLSAGVSISSEVSTVVLWSVSEWSSLGTDLLNIASNPDRIFIGRKLGWWLVSAYLDYSGSGAGTYRGAILDMNGATIKEVIHPAVTGRNSCEAISIVRATNAGDYVKAIARHNQGGAINVQTTSHFRAFYLGEQL